LEENLTNRHNLLKEFYKPNYSHLFNKIKEIKTPVKNEILKGMIDGEWKSELELIRIAKKRQKYMGAVTLGTMINSLNNILKNETQNYVEKKIANGKMYYKISDNYVGLTRAAYNKYRYNLD
jgi:hypothetical protein